jgi:hypothetical protein
MTKERLWGEALCIVLASTWVLLTTSYANEVANTAVSLESRSILDFHLEIPIFLFSNFPTATFCQPCSHKHLQPVAYPSRPYALSMKLTEATQHIMMKSWPCAWGLFSHRASRFSSVPLGVFSWLSDDFARRNAWETPTETHTETLEKRLTLRRPLHMVVLTNHGRFHGHHTCC